MPIDSSNSSHQAFDQMLSSNQKAEKSKEQAAKTVSQSQMEATATQGEETMPQGIGTTASALTPTEQSSLPDTVLPSGKGEKKPQLPMTNDEIINVEEMSVKSAKGVNLIAIMANVMVLQAKSNEDFFSSLWQEASASMAMEAKLAPIVAKATLNAGLAQADATKAQASESLASGITNICLFGATMVAGGVMTAMEPGAGAADDAEKEGTTQALKQTAEDSPDDTGGITGEISDGVDNEGGTNQEAIQDATQDATKQKAKAGETITAATNKTETETSNIAQENLDAVEEGRQNGAQAAAKNAMDKVGKGAKEAGPILKTMQNCMQVGMTLSMLGQGITGITGFVYKSRQAAYEKEGAEWQAISKMGDVQIQIMGQAFGRAEGMSQQAQQNVNSALQILEGMVQTITQTVNSGFQSI